MSLASNSDIIEVTAVTRTPNVWPTIDVDVGEFQFSMVLDTGSLFSSLAPRTHQRLLDAGHLERHRLGWAIRGVRIGDVDVGDVPIRDVMPGRDRIAPYEDQGVGGILGLTFLQRFAEVCYYPETMRVLFRRA
jgi:hypothetical protein